MPSASVATRAIGGWEYRICGLSFGRLNLIRRTSPTAIFFSNTMPTPFLYSNVTYAPESKETELCQVGPFANRLPSVKGRVFAESDEALLIAAGVPDTKCWRQLARSGCILMRHYSKLQSIVAESGISGNRIGIYISANAGATDWQSAWELAKAGDQDFFSVLNRTLPRKHIFKQGAYGCATQLGIFLGITGPQLTFLEPEAQWCPLLDQARFDLKEGNVEMAILAAANALEDPLAVYYESKSDPALAPVEATACVVLKKGDLQFLPGNPLPPRNLHNFYGPARSVIDLVEAMHHE